MGNRPGAFFPIELYVSIEPEVALGNNLLISSV